MMRTLRGVGILALAAATGCSSGGAGGTDRCPNGQCIRDTSNPLMGDGDGQMPEAGGSGLGDFNSNSEWMPPVNTPAMEDPAATPDPSGQNGDCEEGVFCAPTGPDGNCGTVRFDVDVEVTRSPGNVLLVFDRSQSMQQEWNGTPRWEAAGDAISAALESLANDLNQAGAIMFPTPDPNAMPMCIDPTGIACIFVPALAVAGGSCGVAAAGGAEHIAFQAGPQFVPTFVGDNNSKPYTPVPGGFTPLKEGLEEANNALASANLEGNTAVVIITDGEPNCDWDGGRANEIVSGWAADGISTHVIGLPGVGGMGPGLLNSLAQAGGTGMFVTPADPAALQMQLASIVSETVATGFDSCVMTLSQPAENPEKLLMIVDEPGVGRQRVERSNGWSINATNDVVEMTGGLCDAAMAGRFSSITFEYLCPDREPPPAIDVL